MRAILVAALLMATALPAAADDDLPVAVSGRVVDAQTGEAIAKATVAVPQLRIEVSTDAAGRFRLDGLPAGDLELVVTTIGYGVTRKTVRPDERKADVEIRVGQEALKRSEEVVVEAPPFDSGDPATPVVHTLRGVELRNLAGVLTDDPLRSVQSLPGVGTSDDFYASFASRGSGFDSVGFYLDGVLLNAPFHTIRDVNDGYSLTILNGDVVDSLSLVPGGAPARYGDRTGAVLDVQTREGSRDEMAGRASLGASGLYGTVEGPIGSARKASWLLSARKSYLDYVLKKVNVDSGTTVGYYDATARLSDHPTPAQTIGLTLLHGRSHWEDRHDDETVEFADAGTDLAILQWRHETPRGRIALSSFVARETGRNVDERATETFRSTSDHWGGRADGSRILGAHRLEMGLLVRRLDERAASRAFVDRSKDYRVTEDYDAEAIQWGGYAQETWTTLAGRLGLTAGARFDHWSETGESRLLPRAAAIFALGARTRASAGFGEYAQFPDFAELYGREGNPALQAERSRHFTLGLERRLGDHARVRVDAYDQEEDRLLFARAAEWRLEDGRIVPPRPDATLANALDGRSRGIEVLLQRRSANALSGWIAYSYAHARRREVGTPLVFDSDFDQRHAVTAYASVRLSQTLNLSAKFRYGSGFPVPGFYREDPDADGVFYLSETRNELRPAAYSRLDLRANKAWLFRGWKLTLFAEVLNVLDRTNTRYTGLDGVDVRIGGRAFFETDTLFPLLPSAGITVDF